MKVLMYLLVALSIGSTLPLQADECQLKGRELLKNTDFSRLSQHGFPVHWIRSVHANINSFETEFQEDELTIRQVGHEPWFIFTQHIDAKQLAGKVVVFSAELKLDVRRPKSFATRRMGAGLRLVADLRSPQTGMYRSLLDSVMDHEPRMGEFDWQKVQVVVKVPKKAERVSAGFTLQAEGQFKVRNPSLRRANLAAGPCPRTELSNR